MSEEKQDAARTEIAAIFAGEGSSETPISYTSVDVPGDIESIEISEGAARVQMIGRNLDIIRRDEAA